MLNISKQNNRHKCHLATNQWGDALTCIPIRALTSRQLFGSSLLPLSSLNCAFFSLFTAQDSDNSSDFSYLLQMIL